MRDPRGIFTDLAMPAVAAIAGPMCIKRSALREALDPGQGEAMLGQALHEKPALRFSECSGQGSPELVIFLKGWRRSRVEFSPSPNAYPDIFHPRLDLFARLASRVVDFS